MAEDITPGWLVRSHLPAHQHAQLRSRQLKEQLPWPALTITATGAGVVTVPDGSFLDKQM